MNSPRSLHEISSNLAENQDFRVYWSTEVDRPWTRNVSAYIIWMEFVTWTGRASALDGGPGIGQDHTVWQKDQ